MLMGLEVAGLALAVFPVVIQCLQYHLKFFEEAKKWWRYVNVAKGLLRDLEMENMKFENACEELLFEVVDPAKLHLFLVDPGGPLWQEPHLQIALQTSLGKSFAVYVETVTAIKDALQTLQARLQRAIPEGVRDAHINSPQQWLLTAEASCCE